MLLRVWSLQEEEVPNSAPAFPYMVPLPCPKGASRRVE